MDYKEKYEQALERARQFSEKPYLEDSAGIVEYIFPELVESEDEKIRKAIIEGFLNYSESFETFGGLKVGDIIAWLEKQGEKESDPRYKYLKELLTADDIYQMAMNDAMVQEAKTKAIDALSKLEIGKLLEIEKQGEQHTLQTDEQKLVPKFKIGDKIKLKSEPSYPFREIVDIKNDAYYFDREIHLPFKRQDEWESEEKPAECSEEDESHIRYLIECLEHCKKGVSLTMTASAAQEYINWLKSLRPQSHWKPSDEQMRVIDKTINFIICHDDIGSEYLCNKLNELKQQLKAL